MKRLVLWLCIVFLAACFVSYPLYFHVKKHLEEKIIEELTEDLSDLTKIRVDCDGGEFDCLNLSFKTGKAFFRDDEKSVSLDSAEFTPGKIDFTKKQLYLDPLTITNPQMILVRNKGKFKWFPDFFSSDFNSNSWEFVFAMVHLKNPVLRFIDMDVVPEQMFILSASNFYISDNRSEGTLEIKGSLSEKAMNGAKIYIHLNIDRLEDGFSLKLSGTGFDFAKLSPYQKEWNKMKIQNGVGSFFLELENRIGNLSGILNMSIEKLNFSLLKEDLVSSAFGMTKSSFLSMLEENKGKLDLNFNIGGSADDPVIKLDKRTGNLFYKLPVKLVSGTVKVVAKTVNILMLGIPGRIVKQVRKNKEAQKEKELLKVN